MNILRIIVQISVLYGFYLTGVWLQEQFQLIIPGSIIGMILLFLCLVLKVIPIHLLEKGTNLILRHMLLLFIPVTVGVLNFLDLFISIGIGLFFIAMISTVLVMGISGYICQWIVRRGASS